MVSKDYKKCDSSLVFIHHIIWICYGAPIRISEVNGTNKKLYNFGSLSGKQFHEDGAANPLLPVSLPKGHI